MKFLSCLLAGLLAWTAAVAAEARGESRTPHQERARQERLSLDEVVVNVRRDTGGRVLSAEPRDGRYRIKVLLPDASVRSFDVPPHKRR